MTMDDRLAILEQLWGRPSCRLALHLAFAQLHTEPSQAFVDAEDQGLEGRSLVWPQTERRHRRLNLGPAARQTS